ncbi:MAG: uracil-DNA glycosylase family protein, partial [Bacteroidota bacterium]
PRIHEFVLPFGERKITTVSLTAPSGAANRAICSLEIYKKMKNANPKFTTFDFRVLQYRPFF